MKLTSKKLNSIKIPVYHELEIVRTDLTYIYLIRICLGNTSSPSSVYYLALLLKSTNASCFFLPQELEEFKVHFTDEEKLALLVGCLCHDLDHRGTNNTFQVK